MKTKQTDRKEYMKEYRRTHKKERNEQLRQKRALVHCRLCNAVVPDGEVLCDMCVEALTNDKEVGHITGTCCGDYWFDIHPEIHYRYKKNGKSSAPNSKYPVYMVAICRGCHRLLFKTPVTNPVFEATSNEYGDRSNNIDVATHHCC